MHLRPLLALLAVGAFASPAMGQGGIIGRSGPPSAQLERTVIGAVQAEETFSPPVPDVRVPTQARFGRARGIARSEIIASNSRPILYALTHPRAARPRLSR